MRPPQNVSPALQELLENVDEEREEFLNLGDFDSDTHARLRKAFLPSIVSDTLNIEGIQANPRITLAVLEGYALSEVDKYVETEVRNVIDAHGILSEIAQAPFVLSSGMIKQFNFQIEKDLIATAGTFRQQNVLISGAQITPPSFESVAARVEEVCTSYEHYVSDTHPIVLAAWVHRELAEVHPFDDGNGRTARLLQDLVLVSARFLPVGIPAFRRQEYYDALQAADFNDIEPLAAMIANSELTALTKARRVVRDPGVRRRAIARMVRGREAVASKAREREFEVWRRRVEEFVDEVEAWAAEIAREVDGPRLLRIKLWDPITFESWQEIRDRGVIRNSWVATLFVSEPAAEGFSILLAAKRADKITSVDSTAVAHEIALQVVVAEGQNRYDFHRTDPWIDVHAICPTDSGFELISGENSERVRATATEAVEKLLSGAASKAGWVDNLGI